MLELMAKTRHMFVCRSCGGVQARWLGKCPDCGAWDSLEETVVEKSAQRDPQKGIVEGWAELGERDGAGGDSPGAAPEARPLDRINPGMESAARLSTGIAEFDRVLGGAGANVGMVPGSAVLVGGEPGIGKSTLLLQAAGAWAARGVRTLYVSSEESAEQIKLRAERLRNSVEVVEPPTEVGGVKKERGSTMHPPTSVGGSTRGSTGGTGVFGGSELFILADTNLARIVEQARKVQPQVMVIDSVQMIYKSDLPGAPGSIAQLRRCCSDLVYLAKASGIAVVLVGHVTKEGQLAGPRLLEHLVDCVLYFEGDRFHAHRLVRAIKNRFGTTLEIGLFEMTGAGLTPVEGGAGVIAESTPARPGSAVCPVIAGTRCHLVELQALTATGFLGAAKRKSSGLDSNRLAMLIAVLEQHAGLRLADRDVFASAVGGIRVIEPAADLALLLAIAGAHYRRALPRACAVFGEVGLGGEVRPVPHADQRVREAVKLGWKTIMVPHGMTGRAEKGVEIVRVKTVNQAIEHLSPVAEAGFTAEAQRH